MSPISSDVSQEKEGYSWIAIAAAIGGLALGAIGLYLKNRKAGWDKEEFDDQVRWFFTDLPYINFERVESAYEEAATHFTDLKQEFTLQKLIEFKNSRDKYTKKFNGFINYLELAKKIKSYEKFFNVLRKDQQSEINNFINQSNATKKPLLIPEEIYNWTFDKSLGFAQRFVKN